MQVPVSPSFASRQTRPSKLLVSDSISEALPATPVQPWLSWFSAVTSFVKYFSTTETFTHTLSFSDWRVNLIIICVHPQ